MDNKVDVIVIGAGPSGISSAITIARGGKSVVVLDRGKNFGTKNMFGGVVYLKSIKDLLPNSWQNAPYERITGSHSWSFLTDKSLISMNYKNEEENEFGSASVFRPAFDNWLVEEAKKEGVYFAPSTVVRDLIVEKGKVIGVKTDLEEFYAPITIIAEGANSLLSEKLGLKKKNDPKDIIVGIKETYKLDSEIIEERFNLKSGKGSIMEFFGGLEDDILALGFLYTFKDNIALGLGVSLDDLSKKKLTPYELLEKLKSHPEIEKLIKDGEISEYSAHLIPDGGYKKIPQIYSNGVMLVGDACGFLNPLHFEGTNLAIYSGIYAGETALLALQKNDFSKKTLCEYKKKFEKSFMKQDLRSYQNLFKLAYNKKKAIFIEYPKLMEQFFEMFTNADSTPKKLHYRKFIFKSALPRIFKDCLQFAKTLFEVLK